MSDVARYDSTPMKKMTDARPGGESSRLRARENERTRDLRPHAPGRWMNDDRERLVERYRRAIDALSSGARGGRQGDREGDREGDRGRVYVDRARA